MSIHVAEGKKSIQLAVDARDAQLRELALNIHAHPELSFQEYHKNEMVDRAFREGRLLD